MPLSSIVAELKAKVPVTIVLLDACRNDPFPPGTLLKLAPGDEGKPIGAGGLGETRGVVSLKGGAEAKGSVDDSLGQVIAFAAEPGKVALDGPADGNSPYSAAILRHIDTMGGEEFGTVLRMIGEEVYLKTNGQQRPWVNESLRRLLYFGTPAEAPKGDEGEILRERRQLLLTISTLPDPERRQIETISRDGKVPMDGLYAMLKALGVDIPKDPAELDKLLRGQTERLKHVLAERETLKNPDPEIARLSKLAEQAVQEGALEAAQKFNEQAKARIGELSSTVDQAEAELKAKRLEFAKVFASSARTYEISFNFKEAAQDYAKAFEQAAKWSDEDAFYYKAAEANALSEQGDFSGDNAYLAQALTAYEQALTYVTREKLPLLWAATQNNMGATLATLGEREAGRENLDKAAAAYEQALTVYTHDAYPDDWASTYGNLGTVYWRLGQRENGTALLERAVAAFRSALEVQSLKKLPLEWAATQNNLGIVLSEIGDRQTTSDSFRAAIEAHRAALTEYNRERVPLDWALSQINLGVVLASLGAREKDVPTLEQSVAAFQAAAEEMTRERAPAQWATIQNNLSTAFESIGEINGDIAALQRAREAAEASLTVWTREHAAASWANGQLTLGNALQRLGAKQKNKELLLQAATAYQAALSEYPREKLPLDWASLQQNLGSVNDTLGDLDTGTDYYIQAVTAYRQAWEVYTATAAPGEFASIGYSLAGTLSNWGERAGDISTLRQAIVPFPRDG
ncbi:tetratricopeptide repeat protein [Mesorhizobium sp. M0847]|uniref:tetratricopeptide repeat protein n=1 Tax=unclassified Mesorhizobium TaxID=325217 RepID=UPI00333A64D4